MRKPKIHVDRRSSGNTHGKLLPTAIVIHSTESHDRHGTSDVAGVLGYLERTSDELGIHFVIDAEGKLGQGARVNEKCYHAGAAANGSAVGIELIGFARFRARTWYLRRRQLAKLVELLAWLHVERGISLERGVHQAPAQFGLRGVWMHREVPGNDHWDPGYGFPISSVLRRARRRARQVRKKEANR